MNKFILNARFLIVAALLANLTVFATRPDLQHLNLDFCEQSATQGDGSAQGWQAHHRPETRDLTENVGV